MEGQNVHPVQATIDIKLIDKGIKSDEEQPEKESSPGTFNSTELPTDFASTDLESAPALRKKPITVPRSNRRGLFTSLSILAVVDDPYLYPRG